MIKKHKFLTKLLGFIECCKLGGQLTISRKCFWRVSFYQFRLKWIFFFVIISLNICLFMWDFFKVDISISILTYAMARSHCCKEWKLATFLPEVVNNGKFFVPFFTVESRKSELLLFIFEFFLLFSWSNNEKYQELLNILVQ